MTSKFSKFHERTIEERKELIFSTSRLKKEEQQLFENEQYDQLSDQLVENAFGVMEIPLGAAVNFVVNGRERIIPMATEESSVIAAASHGAKLTRPTGGFTARLEESGMFSQIQILGVSDVHHAKMKILQHKQELITLANDQDPVLNQLGGGAYDITVRVLETPPAMIIVHLHVHTLDAMGANATNTMAEKIAPKIEKIANGEARLRIISNLADKRLVRAFCEINKEDIGGKEVVQKIVEACNFAKRDPYRAATHNKGIMNGITPIVLATGNDTRAVEAGAHAYASRNGYYTSLTQWEMNEAGNLTGSIELPMAVGTIGGATAVHPKAQANLKILQIQSANELAEIIASVGLAQNLTALKALSTEGIQKGHMKLHAKNIALMAGAKNEEIAEVAQHLVKEGKFRSDIAEQYLTQLRGERTHG